MNQTTNELFDRSNTTCAASVTDSKFLKTTKTVILTAIMIIGLFGNPFVMFIVYKKRNMRRTINIFIANMAASDLFIAAVIIPTILTDLYVGPGRCLIGGAIGEVSCKFCYFLGDFSISVSIMIYSVIAVDRFYAIVYSLRSPPITPPRRKYFIALIWLLSFMLNSPNLYSYRLRKIGHIEFCGINWDPLDTKTSQTTFFSAIFAVELCLPVVLMVVLYSWLIKYLGSQRSLSTQSWHMRKKRRKEDILVLRKVLTLLIVFLLSILPIIVLALLLYYRWGWVLPCNAWSYSFAAHLIFLSNSAVNPCLCITLNTSYKHYVQKLWCCARKKNQESTPRQDMELTCLPSVKKQSSLSSGKSYLTETLKCRKS